jgi:hypothetical protein
MMLLLVLQRASISDAVSRLRTIVTRDLGLSWYDTLYSRREHHFTAEKRFLARVVVEDVLPKLVDEIDKANSKPQIRIVLDSGTTITPIFDELVSHGLTNTNLEQVPVEVVTNNLAGIDVIQRQSSSGRHHLREPHFTLLGGTPLATYRATTGSVTEDTLDALLADPQYVTIGVLTANWLTIGTGHNTLALWARGRGHRPFKQLVASSCNYVLVVTPLGKIFCLDGFQRAENLMEKHGAPPRGRGESYEPVLLSSEKRARTFLVTTRRPAGSQSPLAALSARLFGLPSESRTNFSIVENRVTFSPQGSADEIRRVELPHLWTRACTDVLFGEVM